MRERSRAPELGEGFEQGGYMRPKPQPTKLETLIQQLKVRSCEMRSQELYYRAEADRLEECVQLLSPRVIGTARRRAAAELGLKVT
jgi:hypothetical protein